MSKSRRPWWKEANVYQIYPASFLSTKTGSSTPAVGDIPGIISKVPYIASLGFDTIWLSPIYKSPQKDMGYDISDYRDIHEAYGTVADVQELIDTLHRTSVPGQSGTMKLLMDLVVNHTSDQHPWFLESRSSRTNAKHDFYFWRDAKMDEEGARREPNNWRSIFGGPAWHWVEERQQYYLALFLPAQPDLNWENVTMRRAAYDDMRFWLDRGVDGFRIDSMNIMSKHPGLPDASIQNPGEMYQPGTEWYANGPKMHEYLQEMHREVFDKYDTFTVGELASVEDAESVSEYIAPARRELDCVFHGMDLDFGPGGKYTRSDKDVVRALRDVTEKWQVATPAFGGWNTLYLDNHDSGRSVSRYASDAPQHRAAAAKMLATYLCTLSGTPFVLAGQEIGMANLGKDKGIDSYIDVEGRNWYHKVLGDRGGTEGGADMSDVMRELQLKARDHGRLPMQWSAAANAGFCAATATPWMAVNEDFEAWNVAAQDGVAGSVLEYWRELLLLRKREKDVFVHGRFRMLPETETGARVIGYERAGLDHPDRQAVVLLSFSPDDDLVTVSVPAGRYAGWSVLLANMPGAAASVNGATITLRPYEAVVLGNFAA